MICGQIAQEITGAFESCSAELAGEAAVTIKETLIQYGETDWEFLLRLGNRLHLLVYADCTASVPVLYFCMRRGERREWENLPVHMAPYAAPVLLIQTGAIYAGEYVAGLRGDNTGSYGSCLSRHSFYQYSDPGKQYDRVCRR